MCSSASTRASTGAGGAAGGAGDPGPDRRRGAPADRAAAPGPRRRDRRVLGARRRQRARAARPREGVRGQRARSPPRSSPTGTAGVGVRAQVPGIAGVKIIHRQDVPASAELVAQMAGTVHVVWQADQARAITVLPCPRNSTRATRAAQVERYEVHPNEIKTLATGDAVVLIKLPTAGVQRVRVTPARPTRQRFGRRARSWAEVGGRWPRGVRRGIGERQRPAGEGGAVPALVARIGTFAAGLGR